MCKSLIIFLALLFTELSVFAQANLVDSTKADSNQIVDVLNAELPVLDSLIAAAKEHSP